MGVSQNYDINTDQRVMVCSKITKRVQFHMVAYMNENHLRTPAHVWLQFSKAVTKAPCSSPEAF